MKKVIPILVVLFALCGCENYSTQYQQAQVELKQARDSIKMLVSTIDALSYPANQRLANINSLIKEKDFDLASSELKQLVALFPNSPEAKQESSLNSKIEAGIQAKIAEENRIKALGFKALKENLSFNLGDLKVAISNVSVGNTFIFDNYGTEYRYVQADKNCKYVTAAMSITTEETNPKLPQFAIYRVDGDKLEYVASLITRFARWDDYGSYLGNDADYNNDFSKVNTVKFKIGAEIPIDITKQPFLLVMKKEFALSRTQNTLSTPEISYVGSANYKQSLSIDDFKSDMLYH